MQLREAQTAADALLDSFATLAQQAETFVAEMEFGFLFDEHRKVFHIGYNIDTGRLDNSYYDLLASEARIASLVAIISMMYPKATGCTWGDP